MAGVKSTAGGDSRVYIDDPGRAHNATDASPAIDAHSKNAGDFGKSANEILRNLIGSGAFKKDDGTTDHAFLSSLFGPGKNAMAKDMFLTADGAKAFEALVLRLFESQPVESDVIGRKGPQRPFIRAEADPGALSHYNPFGAVDLYPSAVQTHGGDPNRKR